MTGKDGGHSVLTWPPPTGAGARHPVLMSAKARGRGLDRRPATRSAGSFTNRWATALAVQRLRANFRLGTARERIHCGLEWPQPRADAILSSHRIRNEIGLRMEDNGDKTGMPGGRTVATVLAVVLLILAIGIACFSLNPIRW